MTFSRFGRILLFSLLLSLTAFAGKRIINGPPDVLRALKGASAGDTLEFVPGDMDIGLVIITAGGTARRPLVIRAREQGRTKLSGSSQLLLKGATHVRLEGFEFTGTTPPAIEMRSCTFVRVTRNGFRLEEKSNGSWIVITGDKETPDRLSGNNRIDHKSFRKKSLLGNFITIEGSKGKEPRVSQHDRIDANYFADIGPRVENVLEAIRVGSSDFSLSRGGTVIEGNLFERCDGDPEYISIKSSGDTIRHNTFRECLGSLSLRHGNGSVVEGNFILGNGRTGSFTDSTGRTWVLGTGGIRFCGDDMVITNNYLEGLTGSRWDASLAMTNGDAEYGDGKPLTKHFRIRNALIAFNTFVNNRSNMEIGYDGGGFQNNWWKLPPRGVTIANNLVVGSVDTLVNIMTQPESTTWSGNIMLAPDPAVLSAKPIDGIVEMDPVLTTGGPVLHLTQISPAIDAAVGEYPAVARDIDGQPRGARKDVGADEYSSAPAKYVPLTPADVGPGAKEKAD
jgi:hypothetical protein